MMVIFQRKIIYLPSVPLGSRNEQLNQKDPNLSGLDYQEVTIKSFQPTGWSRRTVELKGIQMRCKSDKALQTKNRVIIVYLQGKRVLWPELS